MKQKLTELKGEIGSYTVIVGNFSTPLLTTIQRYSRQVKEIEDLKNSLNQVYQTDIYRTLYQMTTEYTVFSGVDGTLDHSRLGHTLNKSQ